MIHQVRASSDDVARLRELVELQLQLLTLAAMQPSVDNVSLEHHLTSVWGGNASKVADWVCRHSTLISKLNAFAANSSTGEKGTLVNQMRSDVDLLFTPAPRRLQVAFRCSQTSPTDWKCAAGDFCRHFYTIWGQDGPNPGFPDYMFMHAPIAEASYSRWDFINGFLAANDALYLCAICDATAFRTRVDSRAHTSIEHFFPKSIYPHLAIHPYNLIPICTHCNSIKSDDDLMQLCGATLGIQELLLPYQSQQPGLSQMAYVEVSVRTAQVAGSHPLEIKFKSASAIASSASLIGHFKTLYGVEERWNNQLDQIEEQVFRRIQQFLMGDVQMGNDLSDMEFLQERLELLMALTSKENLGKDPFGMATVWMLKYHVDTLRQYGNKALIYENLVQWAEEHRETWKALRDHAKEIHRRVPVDHPKVWTT